MDFTDSGFHFCASQYSSKDYFGGRTPVPIRVRDNEIDIAIGIYKKRNRTHISFIKLVFIEENDILKFELIENDVDQPVLDNGKVGSYCENGIIPSCSISLENKFGLYTIGFDSRNNSIFHASSGLAFLDNNLKVTKHFSGLF